MVKEIKNIKLVEDKVQYEEERIIKMTEKEVDAKIKIVNDRIKNLKESKTQLDKYKKVFK